jgi:hypothetical protein
MTEKRRASRQKSYLRGLVYFGNSPSAIDCLVRDFSEAGARLKFSGTVASTDTLELHIPVKGQTFNAKVIWWDGDEIGITLITDGDVASAGDEELSVRVGRLEGEIAALKQLIKRLQKTPKIDMDAA